MSKIAVSGSISQILGSGSGSTPKCHGSATLRDRVPVHIFTRDETGLVYLPTATLLVMVNVMKGGGRAPPPHPHQPGLILASWWNVPTPESSRYYSVYSVSSTWQEEVMHDNYIHLQLLRHCFKKDEVILFDFVCFSNPMVSRLTRQLPSQRVKASADPDPCVCGSLP